MCMNKILIKILIYLSLIVLLLKVFFRCMLFYYFFAGVALGQSGIISFLNDASDLDANQIIIYNRVPKTGSTSFIGLGYSLCAVNKFNVIHINTTKNAPTLSLTDQVSRSNTIIFFSDIITILNI